MDGEYHFCDFQNERQSSFPFVHLLIRKSDWTISRSTSDRKWTKSPIPPLDSLPIQRKASEQPIKDKLLRDVLWPQPNMYLERILIQCCKTKTKWITITNQNKGKYHKELIRTQSKNKHINWSVEEAGDRGAIEFSELITEQSKEKPKLSRSTGSSPVIP